VSKTLDPGIDFRRGGLEPGACRRCGRKRPMKVAWLRPVHRQGQRWVVVNYLCLDQAECGSYCFAKREKQRKRSGTLIWRESRFSKVAKKGECAWCGEAIVLAEPDDYRRRAREYHYGDEHETGDRNCRKEKDASYAFNPRALIQLRGDPCCVDCGSTDNFDADHDTPLFDGGEHSVTNIVRRCTPCHAAKTAAEAALRAERRRFGSSVAATPSTQQQLVAA